MARPICYCDRNVIFAGEKSTWKFCYTPGVILPKNTSIYFDINSQGRPNVDWEIPQEDLKKKNNIIFGILPDKAIIKAKKVNKSLFEFILPSKIPSGKTFTIVIGTKNKDGIGNQSQTYSQRKRKFFLKIDMKNKKSVKIKEIFHLDVRGNTFDKLKILSPSIATRNKRFDVMLRFEDQYGNLTGKAEEGTLIDLTYENLRENLNWKLFVPETGFLAIPNLYFNETGVYRLKFRDLKTKKEYVSDPIKCFDDTEETLLWGAFHGESENFNATNNIDNFLREARDEKGYDFIGTSSFDTQEETPSQTWKLISQSIAEFNEDFRFSSFLGFQWAGVAMEEGVRQFIYLKDNKNILRSKDLKTNSLKKIYKMLLPKDLLSIPIFTMSKKNGFDFKNYNPDFEKVVEIYNAWGSSECTEKEGNIKPIKGFCSSEANGSIRKALSNNYRFGFIAGGYDDRGVFEKLYDSNQKQYSPGLTAIISKGHTKEEIFTALKKRSCYATTGARIILDFFIAGKPMGSELTIHEKPGLKINRFISASIVGTDILKKVEIIRNGKILKTFLPKELEFSFDFNDSDSFQNANIQKDKHSFIYYYLKVEQNDGNVAWSSPIWIDEEIKKSRAK